MLPILTLIAGIVIGVIFATTYWQRRYRTDFVEPSDKPYASSESVSILAGDGEQTQFVEAVTPKQRFQAAKKITDLTNE